MKVKQIIKKLQKFNPESDVYVDSGYGANMVNQIFEGYYVDNECDAPEVLCIKEDELKDYDCTLDDVKKAVCIC